MDTENIIPRKFATTRTILISPEKHKFLTLMKIEGNYRNVDEVVDVLIQSHQKLKVMELAEKEKAEKNKQKNGKQKSI
jgi:hypothetical protein